MPPAIGVPGPARRTTHERKRLLRVIEVARSLTSDLDLKGILQKVLEGAVDVTPSCDAATLHLYDPRLRKLVLYDSIGFGPELRDIALAPGQGLAGIAFKAGRPQMYKGEPAAAAGMSEIDEGSLLKFRLATGGVQYPKGAVALPLIFKREPLGALVVENLHTAHDLDDFDLEVLGALAQSAATAIANARLYEAERESRRRLEAVNFEMSRQKAELERRLQVGEILGRVVREGLPLSALATQLHSICDASVVVMDAFNSVRASEPSTAGARLFSAPLASGAKLQSMLRYARTTRVAQRQSNAVGGQVVVVPVSGALDVLGYLVLDFGPRVPDAVDETAADSAALIVATEFLKERALHHAALQRDSELVSSLLGGRHAGTRPPRPPVVIAVGSIQSGTADEPTSSSRMSALAGLLINVRSEVTEAVPGSLVAGRGDEIIVIGSAAGGGDREIQAAIDRAIDSTSGTLVAHSATFAVSDAIDALGVLPGIYEEASNAVTVRIELGGPAGSFPMRSLGVARFLFRAARSHEFAALCRSTVAPVLEYDRAHGGQLLETYREYLRQSGGLKRTANSLGVHVHTVQHRLRRLQELSGLRLNDPGERLTLEMVSRVVDLAGL
jgi:PucR C-terminal helix-turn-helix domain/GAF domain/GGDEF-like domain